MEPVFPEFRDRIQPFAFDWLGRHFALDRGRVANGSAQVLMLKVGVGEAMQGERQAWFSESCGLLPDLGAAAARIHGLTKLGVLGIFGV